MRLCAVIAASMSLVAYAAGGVSAQVPETAVTAKQRLTGDAAREWVLQEVHSVMGSTDRCTQGEVHRFAQDGRLTVERCVEGRMTKSERHWEVTADGPYDLRLSVDGEPSTLLFKDEGTAQLMTLRRRSGSKTSPTEDRVFRLSLD